MTDLGTLTIPKSDVDKRVKIAEAIQAEAQALKEKARVLFQEALSIDKDARARNGMLREAAPPVSYTPGRRIDR